MIEELYFSADVETDGPIPGPNSMLSFGVVAFKATGEEVGAFEANLDLLQGATPDQATMDWWKTEPKAWAACRQNPQDPEQVLKDFVEWVNKLCGQQYIPIMVCMPSGFDYLFMYWYMKRFTNQSPFSHSCIDMRSYVMAMQKVGYKQTGKRFWPHRWFPKNMPHTHVAIEDAREQGLTFINMMKENNSRRR